MLEHGRGSAARPLPATVADTQPSLLLARLIETVDPDRRLNVLNLGPALPETVEFFSAYRCRLHITDLYRDLPFPAIAEIHEGGDEEGAGEARLDALLDETLALPSDTTFDILFFWDLLNYMSRDAIGRLIHRLRPHLHETSSIHCFAVHNTQAQADHQYYGIADAGHLSVRQRAQIPAAYQPHAQSELLSLLQYFVVDRSVLMRDQRTELLLKIRSLQD